MSFNIGKKDDDGRDKCIGVRGIMGHKLLTENSDHNYRVYPKNNGHQHNEDTPYGAPDSSDAGSDAGSDAEEASPKKEVEVINKEAPEGIEVAEFEGLNINEEMG